MFITTENDIFDIYKIYKNLVSYYRCNHIFVKFPSLIYYKYLFPLGFNLLD